MRLEVNHDRAAGGWDVATVYIYDEKMKFGLNPNAVGTLRIFGAGGEWQDFDLSRLQLIHRLLLEARGASREARDDA